MKSVLRSAFDPVPRPLSPGTQLLVVGVLIVGITISVFEYMESSRPAPLVQGPLETPASLEQGARGRTSTELNARPRSLVRAAPAQGPADAGGPVFSGTSVEPSAAHGAPMSFQPGEDG